MLALGFGAGCGTGGSSGSDTSGDEDPIMFEDEREAAGVPAASEAVGEGEALLARGEASEAEALFRRAIEEHAQDGRAHLDLGLALEMQERFEDAEASYRTAIEVEPELAEAHNNLGVLLRDLERADEAVTVLREAVRVRPGLASAHLNLAMALEEAGEADDAMASYRRVIELAPREPTARIQLGLLQLAAGNQDEARITLRRAAGPAEGSRAMLSALGNGLRRARDAEMAVRVLRAAIAAEETPAPPAVHAELALALFAADRRPAAEQALSELIEAHSDYATAHYLLAGMLASREAFAEAARHYQAYLRIEPRGPQAERARRRLEHVRAQ